MRLWVGNHLERLLERLLESIDRPLPSPLEPESIVVPNRGMARWLSRELAAARGISAHVRFFFPEALLWELVRRVLGLGPEPDPFEPTRLGWRVFRLLPEVLSSPSFEPVRAYMGSDGDELKAFQLSRRIAETLDRYTLYRPDLVLRWEAGEGEGWQPELWRRLAAEASGRHKAALRARFLERLRKAPPEDARLPLRLSVFGISVLAPLHLELLEALSAHLEVTLYALNPTQAYWGDVRTRRRVATPLESAPDEAGNALLSSLGRVGRDFFERLLAGYDLDEQTCFEEPGEASLLSCIQSDILHLRERGDGAAAPALRLSREDRSVQIHSCHGPLREVEVLHDFLLSLFDGASELRPEDVVVMAPDVESYAPFVSAVFDAETDRSRRIPYSVADRPDAGRAAGRQALLRLLALAGGRLEAESVLDLLEAEALRGRFRIGHRELELIEGWVAEARVRWGRDAEDRARRGLPAFAENSWAFGLDRLLLGYAMESREEALFAGILPCQGIEGPETETLGRFCDFLESLFTALDDLALPRPPAAWAQTLRRLADAFLVPEAAEEAKAELREAFHALEAGGEAGCREPIELRTVRHLLREIQAKGHGGAGFLSGGVTFCTLRPMRSLPFRVVALLGMNDGAFPRAERRLGFDLLASAPRPGDPSPRWEDRYLFLEALLSARDVLYVSYSGQSARDGSEAPPSVLVSELLDVIGQGFQHPDGPLPDRLVTKHRIQAFSPSYFRPEGELFSYSEESFRAARARASARRELEPFLRDSLPEPDGSWRVLPVDRLAEFFASPCRFLLRHRLGVDLSGVPEAGSDREAFALEGLDRYGLKQELATGVLRGDEPQAYLSLAKARGVLPPGNLGEVVFEAAARESARFARTASRYLVEPEADPVQVELVLGDFRLTGSLPGVRGNGLARWRCATLKAKDWLRLWVEHLALNAVRTTAPSSSLLLGTDGAWKLLPVKGADELLAGLLELYWEGLRIPLPLFPESSLAYAGKAEDPRAALRAAELSWLGSDFATGEAGELAHRICFGREALGERFQELARAVWGPLLQAREKLS